MQGRAVTRGARWGWSKKSKPIPAPPRGEGLKSCPTTFAGREIPAWGKAGRGGLSWAGKNCHL